MFAGSLAAASLAPGASVCCPGEQLPELCGPAGPARPARRTRQQYATPQRTTVYAGRGASRSEHRAPAVLRPLLSPCSRAVKGTHACGGRRTTTGAQCARRTHRHRSRAEDVISDREHSALVKVMWSTALAHHEAHYPAHVCHRRTQPTFGMVPRRFGAAFCGC